MAEVEPLTRLERIREECNGLTLGELEEKIIKYQSLNYEARMNALACRFVINELEKRRKG